MKIINREPRGGKTTCLVDLMAQPGNEDVVLVAPSIRQAEAAYDTFVNRYGGEFNPDPGLRKRFISVQQLPPHGGRYPVPRYVFDELEGSIGFLAGGDVLAVTGTDEDLKRGWIWHRQGRQANEAH